ACAPPLATLPAAQRCRNLAMLTACSRTGFGAMYCRLLLLCILLACGPAALAQHKAYKEVESSLFVTGTIDVTPAGEVAAYTLKQSEKLPSGIVDMVASMAPQWKFEPV